MNELFDTSSPPVPAGTYAALADPMAVGFSMNAANLNANFTGALAGNAAANWTTYQRLTSAGTATSAMRVKIGTSSGNVCVSVHASTGSGLTRAPAARTATSGSVPCPSAGVADIALGGSVTPALTDYFAWGTDNTSATAATNTTIAASTTMTDTLGRVAVENVFPAPASAAPAATSTGAGSLRAILMVGV